MNARELRAKREDIVSKQSAMIDQAEKENRDFTPDEQKSFDDLGSEAGGLEKRIKNLESVASIEGVISGHKAPAVNKTRLGDSEQRAIGAYVRTGDMGAVRELRDNEDGHGITITLPREVRAVDSTMNATTDADGKYSIPTGFSQQIAARRNEVRLAERLGVRNVPGVGTTVNYPYQNADPVVFATTSEQADAHSNNYERDALVLGIKAFTLAKKTKKVELTEELMADEDANLMAFITDSIGRSIGMTHNSLLLTEIASSGTSLKTFASTSAIASGELEAIAYHDTLSYYLDDGGSIGWVTRPTTFGAIASLAGNPHIYSETPQGARVGRTLLGYPLHHSNYATAITASSKSIYFGNWYYVGLREDPALSIIRDPYSVDGLVVLKYSFRLCYGVLIAGAVGYGVHPTG